MIVRKLFSLFSFYFYRLKVNRSTKLTFGFNSVTFIKFKVNGINNSIKIGNKCLLRNTSINIKGNNNSVVFENNTRVYERLNVLIEGDNCELIVHCHTTIGSAKLQLGESSTKVVLGEDCMLSRDIVINTSDFHSILDNLTNKRINKANDVFIGNHVWIGNGVYINKGAVLNNDSIVAARSVVPGKVFASNSIIGGVPAKVIKEGVNWDRKKI